MENTELKTEISDIDDRVNLEPKAVVIKEVKIEEVGEKKSKKVTCSCLHPDSNELIQISQAKIEINPERLEVVGLWLNLNKTDSKIRKNSTLAKFMRFMKVGKIEELQNKSAMTVQDEKKYLAFKGY